MDKRTERAIRENMEVFPPQGEGPFLVRTRKGTYEVSLDMQSCTCPDCRERKLKCKHLWKVELEGYSSTPIGGEGYRGWKPDENFVWF